MKISFFNFSCPKCDDDDHHQPAVCGSDHKTYKSICHLRAAACIAKTAIILLKNGACGGETSPLHPGESHGKPSGKPEGGEGIDSFFSDQQREDGEEDARWGGGAGTDKDFPRSTDDARLLKDQGDEGDEDARWGGGAGIHRGADDARLIKDQGDEGDEDARWGGGAGTDGDFSRSTDDARLLKDQEEDEEYDNLRRDDDS